MTYSYRLLIRKLLGRRLTFFIRNIVSEIAFHLGYYEYADTTGRENCISAMVCTYNESDWIEPSLLSIADFVEEYIVVDSSFDETPQIIENLRKEKGLNIVLLRTKPGNLVEARNLALKRSSCKWILHWDADFIAREDMAYTLRNIIDSLDPKKHYLIYWPHIALCADLNHVCSPPLHIEHWLFTWSKSLRYQWVGKYDSLIAPLHLYKVIFIEKPLSIHLRTVRSPARYAFKIIWWRFREEFNLASMKGLDIWSLAIEKAKKIYGIPDLETLGRKLIDEERRRLQKFDPRIYGELPRILVDYARRKGLL